MGHSIFVSALRQQILSQLIELSLPEIIFSNSYPSEEHLSRQPWFARGKVNALNEQTVQELRECFENLAVESHVKAIILTGQGTKFFSFRFDIPEFLSYSKEAFAKYVEKFIGFYTYLFTYPKPLVAALNGHTIAGGCMLALACDYRVMVSGRAKISLNEITFGSSLFAGSLRMLKFVVGERNAQAVAYSGAMYR